MDRIEQVQSTSTCIHYLCSQVPVLSLFTISASNQNEHARIRGKREGTKFRLFLSQLRTFDFGKMQVVQTEHQKNSISLKKPIGTRKSFTATCSTYSYVSDKYECL